MSMPFATRNHVLQDYHCSKITEASRRLKPPATRLFFRRHVLTTKETSKLSSVDKIICNICSCPYETIHTEVSVCRLRFKKSRFAALSLQWSTMSGMASPNHYRSDCSFHNLLGLVTKGTKSKALYSWDLIIIINYFGESRFAVSSL